MFHTSVSPFLPATILYGDRFAGTCGDKSERTLSTVHELPTNVRYCYDSAGPNLTFSVSPLPRNTSKPLKICRRFATWSTEANPLPAASATLATGMGVGTRMVVIDTYEQRMSWQLLSAA